MKRTSSKSSSKDLLFKSANEAWDSGDLEQAFALFTQAAKSGDAGSQVDLGYFYDNGLFVRKNREKALKWYHKAYRQGHASGANNIATVYRDLRKTRKMLWWFRRAASMGDTDVLLDLGRRYEAGDGVPKALAKARLLYRRALASKYATKENRSEALARLTGMGEKIQKYPSVSRPLRR